MPFWLRSLLRLLPLIVLAALLATLHSPTSGWLVLTAGFAAAYLFHLRQFSRLLDWLTRDMRGENPATPDAFGAWGDVFAALHRNRRLDLGHRDQLAASLQQLEQAAEAMPDGILLLDRDDRIEWFNGSARRLLGLDGTRDRGAPVAHLLREPAFQASLRAKHLADVPEQTVINSPLSAGQILSLLLVPYGGSRHLLIVRDVTALEKADTVRRDFIANVSHELRTPLTVILGFLENQIDHADSVPEALQRPNRLMYEQTLRMQRLVEDLLTLSRLESGHLPAHEGPVDLAQLAANLQEEGLALSAGRHRLQLDCVQALHLRGNADELRTAFSNLVSNAIRYTPEGGEIMIRVDADAGGPWVEISDSGIGIPAEHLPRLCERFYRVDRGRSSAAGGTGLGLAIVKHALSRHGGTLDIRSTPGQGSCFRARFPVDRLLPT